MKSLLLALLLVALCAYSLASSSVRRTAPRCVLEESCSSKDWVAVSRANPDEVLRLVVAVREKNLDVLDQVVADASDLRGPKYGKHLTLEQLGQLTRDDEAVATLEAYFNAFGIRYEKTVNSDFFVVYVTVAKAEAALKTKFHRFESKATGKSILRAFQYTIPKALEDHVELIGDVISFPVTLRPAPLIHAHSVSVSNAAANGTVTPAFIASFYNVKDSTVDKSVTNSLFESGQDFAPKDLSTFQSQFNLPQVPVANVVGNNNGGVCTVLPNSCVEANLDVQYITAVAQKASTTYWSQANSEDVFLSWIVDVANTTNPPQVHSISYGSLEPEENADELKQFDQEAAKLNARGVTIVVSSGDDGVANFQARNDSSKCGFTPSFPATATNVLAVGATQGPESGKAEIMCSSKTGGIVTSGGGFSTVFAQPSYQSSAVSSYLQSGVTLPPSGQYVATGRGYPDVALLGYNYQVVIGGKTYGVSGTSCSAPTMAGVLTLVNYARAQNGKSSIGAVTPQIYQLFSSTPSTFNDITQGENNCCAAQSNPVCCPYGFKAYAGWDPTTGVGSVDVQKLINGLSNV